MSHEVLMFDISPETKMVLSSPFFLLLLLLIPRPIPSTRVGDGWGTSVWYGWALYAAPGEVEQLSKAFRVVRTDILWSTVERAGSCGTFDFSHYYDPHLALMQAHNLTVVWIVDYANAACGGSAGDHLTCSSPKCIAAYAAYAAAIVERYAGNSITWECMNEPDGMGNDAPNAISALCTAAGAHFASAGEAWVGPAVSNLAFWDTRGVPGGGIQYLNDSFAAGLLHSLTAVSVHPYRPQPPETALPDYAKVRALLAAHGKPLLPVVQSEWGYTSTIADAAGHACWGRAVSAQTQGKYLVRQWLTNLLAGIHTSVNYAWQDGGNGVNDCESNYGAVLGTANATGNASLPFPPKPAYTAALAAQNTVGEAAAFVGRVGAAASPTAPAADLFVLEFAGGPLAPTSFAAWSTARVTCAAPAARLACGGGAGATEAACIAAGCCFDYNTTLPSCYAAAPPVQTTFPAPPLTCFAVTTGFGGDGGELCADAMGALHINLTDAPVYLVAHQHHRGSTGGAASSSCVRTATQSISGAAYGLVATDATALCAVHDPCIVEEGGVLYVFSTDAGAPPSPPLLRVRTSADQGVHWATGGAVFPALPAWAAEKVPRATGIWAPDASLVNGRWCLYYAVSSFGSSGSVIGLATTASLASPNWVDEGLVIESTEGSGFNAIDPNLVEDTSVSPPAYWLVFGSFWSGIHMIRIDPASGKPAAWNSTVVPLARRAPPDALEGAFLVPRGGAHFLFVSWDYCCRGAASNYSVRVGKSVAGIEGPYIDRTGVQMMEGGGSLVVGGGFGWAAGGGAGVPQIQNGRERNYYGDARI